MPKTINNQKGFAAFYVTILILAVVFGIAVSISFLTLGQQKIAQNIVKSSQVYYTAEAGIEDILLRLQDSDLKLPSTATSTLAVGEGTATIHVSGADNSKTITSNGGVANHFRKIEVTAKLSSYKEAFNYAVQVGDKNLKMKNGSRIIGNVYSNSSAVPPAAGHRGEITGTIIVALNGNRIENLDIGDDAYAYSCKNCDIEDDLHYVTGGTVERCEYDELEVLSEEIEAKDFPISAKELADWEADAADGGIISGDYVVARGESVSLGPKKIDGNLILEQNAELTITGTIWVTKDITIENNAIMKLDSGYEERSGIVLADNLNNPDLYGKINIGSDVILDGSGTEGSYILLLSTNTGITPDNPAIDVGAGSSNSILYASEGMILLNNTAEVKQLTGQSVYLENNVEVTYESGLADVTFTGGPGAGWQVKTWKEIE